MMTPSLPSLPPEPGRGYNWLFDQPLLGHCMFTDFLGFLMATGLCHHQVSHSVLLMFMQFLSETGHTAPNIANYMTGIRAQFIIHNLDTIPFRHEQIQLFSKALKLDRPLQPKSTAIISTDLLKDILLLTQQS